MMQCKICSAESRPVFNKKVLGKYDVTYYRCDSCLFLQTEDPYWLAESYESAITSLDIGLVYRNQYIAPLVTAVIKRYFDTSGKYVDFGGGYGMFVRMLRDAGLDFYRQDKYCANLFAKHFDVTDLPGKVRFSAVTAFEVFEHLANPLDDIKEMLDYSGTIIFSTDLQPDKNLSEWEYLVPEVGQHVSMYHYKTLIEIGRKFKLNVYSNGRNFHMLTPAKINTFEFRQLVRPRLSKLYLKLSPAISSRLPSDYEMIKKLLQ